MASEPPAPAVAAFGWLLAIAGAMVLHAGLVGAAICDGGVTSAPSPSVGTADGDYPEGTERIVAYLRAHPRSPGRGG